METIEYQLEFLHTIFKNDYKDNLQKYSQYFARWVNKKHNFVHYVEEMDYIFHILGAKRKVVLDIGCGFGFYSMIFAILGCSQVIAMDHNLEKIEVLNKILSEIRPTLPNIQTKLSCATNIELLDSSVDVVLANEVISHVKDTEHFLDEITRVLKRGGTFYIGDGNNSLCFSGRSVRRKIWLKYEYGPLDPLDLRANDSSLPFFEIRKKMIAERYQDLDKNDLNRMAKLTAGLHGKKIIQAVDQIRQLGFLENKPEFSFRNPITGEFQEKEFNPLKLKRRLKRKGYRVKILPPQIYQKQSQNMGKLIKDRIKKIIRLFPVIIFFIKPKFQIYAINRKLYNEQEGKLNFGTEKEI